MKKTVIGVAILLLCGSGYTRTQVSLNVGVGVPVYYERPVYYEPVYYPPPPVIVYRDPYYTSHTPVVIGASWNNRDHHDYRHDGHGNYNGHGSNARDGYPGWDYDGRPHRGDGHYRH